MTSRRAQSKLHRALADEGRARIVEELRSAAGDGLDVHELGTRLGLHPNTIRWHLAILGDAGIVSSRPGERTSPGRPRVVYTLRGGADEDESYRLFAAMLTGAMADLEDGPERARAAGRAWGRYLVRRPPPNVRMDEAEAVEEIVQLLDQQGFCPEARGGEIHMRRCPFHDLAEANPGIVCGVHHGLVDGAFKALGATLRIERLDAFVEPELCIAHLRTCGEQEPNGEG